LSTQSTELSRDERGVGLLGEPLTVTVRDALRISGLGNTKLYELIADGRLRSTTIDGRRLINYASLKQLLTGAEADAATKSEAGFTGPGFFFGVAAAMRAQPSKQQPRPGSKRHLHQQAGRKPGQHRLIADQIRSRTEQA
jgi:hypothetical protein